MNTLSSPKVIGKVIAFAASLACLSAHAQLTSFTAGGPILSSEINNNFSELEQRISAVQQENSYDGTAVAVDCSENPSALSETMMATKSSPILDVTIFSGVCAISDARLLWAENRVIQIRGDAQTAPVPTIDFGETSATLRASQNGILILFGVGIKSSLGAALSTSFRGYLSLSPTSVDVPAGTTRVTASARSIVGFGSGEPISLGQIRAGSDALINLSNIEAFDGFTSIGNDVSLALTTSSNGLSIGDLNVSKRGYVSITLGDDHPEGASISVDSAKISMDSAILEPSLNDASLLDYTSLVITPDSARYIQDASDPEALPVLVQ